MSSEVPLKIRADIRDQWDSPKAPIHDSINELTATLGHKVVPQVQWGLLYNSVKDVHEDKSTFVPTITRFAAAFYGRLLSRLENEANSDWTEELLSEMAKRPAWLLQIESSSGPIRRPRVTWKGDVGAFYLEIPNCTPPLQAEIDAGIDEDLDNLFSPSGAATSNDDEWAEVTEVVMHTPQKQYTVAASHATILEQPAVSKLPALQALARPTDLFIATVPYVLIVDANTSPLTIQGSHQPSLELLAAYLKKWAKTNANDSQKRPVLKVDLIESAFCFGVIDAISIEHQLSYGSREKQPINPAIILTFIEGVLGYRESHTTGYRWVYKLDRTLK